MLTQVGFSVTHQLMTKYARLTMTNALAYFSRGKDDEEKIVLQR